MNHPSIKDIQNYFESIEDKSKTTSLKKHIESCDKCTLILSQMAKIDILLNKDSEVEVSTKVQAETFFKASSLLKEKRLNLKKEKIQKEIKLENIQVIKNFLTNYTNSTLKNLKYPLAQASALLVLIAFLTEASRDKEIIQSEKILKNEFSVVYAESEGEISE